MNALPKEHEIKNILFGNCFNSTEKVKTLSNLDDALNTMTECNYVESAKVENIDKEAKGVTFSNNGSNNKYYNTVTTEVTVLEENVFKVILERIKEFFYS